MNLFTNILYAILGMILCTVVYGFTVTAVIKAGEKVARLETQLQEARTDLAFAESQRQKAVGLLETIFNEDIPGALSYWRTPVTVSAYTARVEECDETPEVTAFMYPSRVGLLAVSRDLLDDGIVSRGDVVMLQDGDEFLGVFIVADKMAERIGRQVDILHGNVEAARLFGIRKNVQLMGVIGKRRSGAS